MLHVKATVGDSEIHGKGLIAAQDIPRGTLIWTFDPSVDHEFRSEDIQKITDAAERERLLDHAYKTREGIFLLCGDEARYMNHSNTPNTISVGFHENGGHGATYAAEDISIGREITEDYLSFEDPARLEEYGIPVSHQPDSHHDSAA